jgi:DtxR family transcriptional regulator, Mn-dependent transcriptional regulator
VNRADDLIDTGEMYLRCVLELEEEGVVPLRSRLAGRLGHTVPTVSQTVARMERDGLLSVSADRRIELTPQGRAAAVRVMRKHRIAECMLADVLGFDWQLVHDEACRWEHVISEAAERRVLDILGHPRLSPYGNPIPGLAELGDHDSEEAPAGVMALARVPEEERTVTVRRIAEPIQSDTALLTRLRRTGFRPGATVPVSQADGRILVGAGAGRVELDEAAARRIFVTIR